MKPSLNPIATAPEETMPRAKPITLDTRTVGSKFATVGVILRVTREIARCESIVPYGFHGAARDQARALAARLGYSVTEV
jgi:hypothetical protein